MSGIRSPHNGMRCSFQIKLHALRADNYRGGSRNFSYPCAEGACCSLVTGNRRSMHHCWCMHGHLAGTSGGECDAVQHGSGGHGRQGCATRYVGLRRPHSPQPWDVHSRHANRNAGRLHGFVFEQQRRRNITARAGESGSRRWCHLQMYWRWLWRFHDSGRDIGHHASSCPDLCIWPHATWNLKCNSAVDKRRRTSMVSSTRHREYGMPDFEHRNRKLFFPIPGVRRIGSSKSRNVSGPGSVRRACALVAFSVCAFAFTPPNAPAASRVSISPPINVITVTQGSEASGNVTVRLLDEGPVRVSVSAEQLMPADLNGFVVPDARATGDPWVIPSVRQVLLTSSSEHRIPYQVRVPAQAAPGAHAFAVLVTRTSALRGTNTDGNSGVSASGVVGAVIVVTVPGDLRSSMKITNVRGPRWARSNRPARFAIDVSNTGNTLLTPRVSLHTGSFLGIADERIDTQANHVLPSGARRISATWESPPLIGWFHPRVIVEDDSARTQTVELASVFVIPPWWLITLTGAGILLPVLALWISRRRRS